MPLPESAELFMKYDYAETKDLCEHFLTVVAGILVFSVAFSEKIVGYPKTSLAAKNCLVATWGLFIVSIVACGIGLTLIALAGGDVVYNNVIGYPPRANTAYLWITAACLCFVAGLGTLIVSAIIAVYAPPMSVNPTTIEK
jgi:hypothetical protein